MPESQGFLYDPDLSLRLVQRPPSDLEANAALQEIRDQLKHPVLQSAFDHFMATASLREKGNLLNSRSYFLPTSGEHAAEADHVTCKQVCEQVCRIVCAGESGGHDPTDCHNVCHEVCSCVFG